MKNLLIACLILFVQFYANAQGASISDNGAPADQSAMLDVSSHTKGVLIPRLRTLERLDIQGPAEGLFVYDVDTRSFWFQSQGQWKELLKSGSPLPPSGLASGDLSGNYPSPTVAKLQNLDVAFGVPFDKQVLKWDALNNNWKGRNDSLFLPYNAIYGSPANLFSIINNNTTAGSSGIFGRSGSPGSGINPGFTKGVWGDNANGVGVAGTSSASNGIFGSSIYNHGIVGYSGNTGYAGVYGSHEETGGIGVMGDMEENGISVYGRNTGSYGNAGVFETTSVNHSDTTLAVNTQGLGQLASFNTFNSSNTFPVIDLLQNGNGNGLKIRLNKATASGNGIDVITQGNGRAIYGKSDKGTAAQFEITTATNANPTVAINNSGLGSALSINSFLPASTGAAIDVFTLGTGGGINISTSKGRAAALYTSGTTGTVETLISTTEANAKNAYFKSDNSTCVESDLYVEQNGLGRGVDINLTKSTNTKAGLFVNTAGNRGVEVITAGATGILSTTSANNSIAISAVTGTANNAIAIKGVTGTTASGAIGVLGQAGSSDPTGIGVKGIAGGGINAGIGVLGEGNSANPNAIGVKGTAYTHNEDVGAVTGINLTDGVGVYGESVGFDGIGVAGTVGNTGNHSVAAMFTNKYSENNRAVMELHSNGKGTSLFSDNTNLGNTDKIIQIRNAGTGKFLSLETNLGTVVTSIAKNGDVVTAGTVTVKGDKGIVRNSTSTQLMTQILTASIPAGSLNHYDDQFNGGIYITYSFGAAFSSTPSVYIGNVVSGSLQGLTAIIRNVTTTSCELVIGNYTPYNFSFAATELKIIAIGAE